MTQYPACGGITTQKTQLLLLLLLLLLLHGGVACHEHAPRKSHLHFLRCSDQRRDLCGNKIYRPVPATAEEGAGVKGEEDGGG